jgi:hypothetical protein
MRRWCGNVWLQLEPLRCVDNVNGKGAGCYLQRRVSRLIKLVRLGEVVEVPQELLQAESFLFDGCYGCKIVGGHATQKL